MNDARVRWGMLCLPVGVCCAGLGHFVLVGVPAGGVCCVGRPLGRGLSLWCVLGFAVRGWLGVCVVFFIGVGCCVVRLCLFDGGDLVPVLWFFLAVARVVLVM